MMKKEKLQNIVVLAWIVTGALYGMTDNNIFLGSCGTCFVFGFLVMALDDG